MSRSGRFTRILVVLIMTCIPFYARAQSAKQSLKTGKEQYDRKEYDQAIISFTDAITLCDLGAKKLMSDAYYRRGNAYDKKGEYDKAIADYNNSLSFDVYNFDSQSARAFMYYKKGEYDKAIKAYRNEIYLESGNRDAYVRLIASLVRTQKFDETYKFADQFKTKGRGANVYGSAQWIFFSYYLVAVANDIPTGKYAAALTNLNIALERCTPKIEDGSQDMYINILVLKGYVLEKLHWKAEAIEVYNKALAMNKQQPDVKAALGRLIQSPVIVAAQTDKVVPANKIVAQADKMPPQIIITSPLVSRGLKVVQKTKLLRVSGKAVDESGIYTVMVNDVEASLDAAGNFTASIPLAIGNNTFVITATDTKMNEATYNFTVTREADKITPDIVPVLPVAVQTLPVSKYYALIIGVQDYADESIPDLDQPIADAASLSNILVSRYTFEDENVTFLKNPTRSQLFNKLEEMAGKVKDTDNLLIFYAGHGYWDVARKQGYWFPADAGKNDRSSWLTNADLKEYISAIPSKHTLLITDACFAGGIFKSRAVMAGASRAVKELYNLPSRKAMTSGTLKEVPDKSVFIEYLVKRLAQNPDQYLSAEQLFSSFRTAVINNSANGQVPQFGEIKEAGDEGGDFIFIKKTE